MESISFSSVQGNSSPKVRHWRREDHLKRPRWHVLNTKRACERCTSNSTSAFNLQDLLKRPRIHQIYTKRACEDRIQTASALQFRLRAFYLIEQPISLTICKGWLQGMKKKLSNNSNNNGRSSEELDIRWYEKLPAMHIYTLRLKLVQMTKKS